MRFRRRTAVLASAALLMAGTTFGYSATAAAAGPARKTAAGQRQVAAITQAEADVRAALAGLDSWLGQGENGRRWRRRLLTEPLKQQLERGANADPNEIASALAAYESGAPGLDRQRFVAVRTALGEWLDRLDPTTKSDLPQLARSAKDRFEPITPERLEWARRRLTETCESLDRELATSHDHGQAWKEYLLWDQLNTQLQPAAQADPKVLAKVYGRFTADHQGLERPPCLAVAAAVRSYLELLSVARMDQPAESYKKTLESLAKHLADYCERPTESDRNAIGQELGWLAGSGRAIRLVHAARRIFSRRNLYAEASARLVDLASRRPIDQYEPVTDVILGTRITANTHTTGQIRVQLVPCDHAVMLTTMMQATAASDSVGRNGPVTIYSDAATEIRASKRLRIDADGIYAEPASSHATTHSLTRGIATRDSCLSGLVRRLAWRRIGKQKACGEAIAARHAEQRVNRHYDSEAAEQAATSNRRLTREFRDPLLRQRAFPQRLEVSSSRHAVYLNLLQATPFQIGAPGPPPELTDRYDLALRMHQSLVNNLAASLLAGKTLNDDQARKMTTELLGRLPEEMASDDEEPWSLTFDPRHPVTVEIADRRFVVTIRGSRFTSGERKFKAMNISAHYAIERTPAGAKLVCQGDLEIVPPRFNPKTGRLSAAQIALRQILKKKLSKLFKPEIVFHGLQLPGELKKVGKLRLAQLTTSDGWVALGWRIDQ